MHAPPIEYAGFPPPHLGDTPQRLKVYYAGSGLLALEKPSDTLVEAHPWHTGLPCIVKGLQAQASAGKPELAALNIKHTYAVFNYDYESSGIALLSTDKDSSGHYRNLYGSDLITLKFHFLTRQSCSEDTMECPLPIAIHRRETRMIVSHKTGKQAHTRFTRLKNYGAYTWWEAETHYCRMHQIRIHAWEKGIPIIGENLYTSEAPLQLTMPARKGRSRSLSYEGFPLHLASIAIRERPDAAPLTIEAPYPKKMSFLLENLEKIALNSKKDFTPS